MGPFLLILSMWALIRSDLGGFLCDMSACASLDFQCGKMQSHKEENLFVGKMVGLLSNAGEAWPLAALKARGHDKAHG